MPGRREPGRMPGSSQPQDAASMHKLTADTVQSARRRKHVRTHGAGHDARLHSDIACLSCRLISVLYYIVYYYIEIPREPAAALAARMGATGLEPVTPAM